MSDRGKKDFSTWEEFEKAKLAGELDSNKESRFADPEYTTWEEFQKQPDIESFANDPHSQNSSKNLFKRIGVIFLCVLLWVTLLAVYVFCIFYPTVRATNIPVDGILAISMDFIFFIVSIVICVKVGKALFLKANSKNLKEPLSENYNSTHDSSVVQVEEPKRNTAASPFKFSSRGMMGKVWGPIVASVLSWVSYFVAMEFYIRGYISGIVETEADFFDFSASRVQEKYEGRLFLIKNDLLENPLAGTQLDEYYLVAVCCITVLCVAFIVFSIVYSNRRREKM